MEIPTDFTKMLKDYGMQNDMPTLAVANNNPGNLKNPQTGNFHQFGSSKEGYAALLNDLQAKKTGSAGGVLGPNSTLIDFATRYAPASDNNNPGQYAANLANQMQVRPDSKLSELDLSKWAAAVANNEDKSSPFANQKIISYEQNDSQNGSYNPKPYSNPEGGSPGAVDYSGITAPSIPSKQDDSLGGHLAGRLNDASQAITDTTSGKQNIASGVLQTVGAGAGAIGDVANAGLELIPGVKWLENVIGQGVGSLAKTSGGKAVIKSMQDFSTAHPELSKDIGAGFNIATAIPILKGLGVVKNLVMDGVSTALKGVAEKSMAEGLTEVASRTVGGRKTLQNAPNAMKTIIDERLIPDIAEGKFITKDAIDKLESSISHIDSHELAPALAKANVPETASRVPLAKYRQEAIAEAEDALKDSGPVEKYFERLQKKYGDYPTLEDMNNAKRIVARNISEAGFTSPTYSVDKIVRSTLQKAVEEGAATLGLEDVNAINAKMRALFQAEKLLSSIDGKAVKSGAVGNFIKTGATVGGEALGNATGIPFAGAYMGYKGGGLVGKKLAGISESILKRTGKGAARQGLMNAPKKLGGLVAGSLTQKASSGR